MNYLAALCACLFATQYIHSEELEKLEVKWVCLSQEKYVQMMTAPAVENLVASCDDDECQGDECKPR